MVAKVGKGEKGRFVTLRSGQVIFIPAGEKSKWADVRDELKAKGKPKGKEYFVGAWVNPGGLRYKVMSVGKGIKAPANLYIDGEYQGTYDSRKEAKKAGRDWKG